MALLIALLAVIVIPPVWVYERIDAWRDERRAAKGKPPKRKGEKGIVRQYLAARKAKVCPRIEVVP